MQFFYALFFFLFSTFVIAAPVPGGGYDSDASAATEVHYYVLKKPGNVSRILTFQTEFANVSPCHSSKIHYLAWF